MEVFYYQMMIDAYLYTLFCVLFCIDSDFHLLSSLSGHGGHILDQIIIFKN